MMTRAFNRLMLTGLLALPLGAPLTGCETNPATGEMQFNTLSREQEIAIGNEAAPQLTQEYGGEVSNAQLQRYLDNVGMAMVPHTEGDYASLPWEFTLLDSDVINAFALPGGKVFISRGLAARFNNEAQLASVVGHEIGHVTARHVNERMSRQMGVELLAGLVGAAAGGAESALLREAVPALVGTAGQGYLLKFGREQELEADNLGIRYMTRAGWDPRGSLQAMQVLADLDTGNAPPEFLSTHPYASTRVEQIQEWLQNEYQQELNNPALELYPERYRQQFLRVLATLPPAPAPTQFAAAHSWCGVCRAHRAEQIAAAIRAQSESQLAALPR